MESASDMNVDDLAAEVAAAKRQVRPLVVQFAREVLQSGVTDRALELARSVLQMIEWVRQVETTPPPSPAVDEVYDRSHYCSLAGPGGDGHPLDDGESDFYYDD